MKSSSLNHLVRALTLSTLAVGFAAACSSSSQGAQGEAGQACYPNHTCNASLVCEAATCVPSGGAGGGATSSATAGSSATTGNGMGGGSSSSAATTGSSSTTTASSGTGSSGTGGAKNGAPVFLSFGTNVTSLTVGATVTFAAVLTDPNGVTDVIGGNLTDQGGASYGAFVTSGQQGAYQLSVTWAQINQVMEIDFAYGATAQRTFTATFFDQGGNTVQKSVTITLTCKGLEACAGACVDTMQDAQNCSTCGHQCASGGGCAQGKCAALTACLPPAGMTTCDSYCGFHGMTCAEACTGAMAGAIVYPVLSCSNNGVSTTCSQNLSIYTASRCCCA